METDGLMEIRREDKGDVAGSRSFTPLSDGPALPQGLGPRAMSQWPIMQRLTDQEWKVLVQVLPGRVGARATGWQRASFHRGGTVGRADRCLLVGSATRVRLVAWHLRTFHTLVAGRQLDRGTDVLRRARPTRPGSACAGATLSASQQHQTPEQGHAGIVRDAPTEAPRNRSDPGCGRTDGIPPATLWDLSAGVPPSAVRGRLPSPGGRPCRLPCPTHGRHRASAPEGEVQCLPLAFSANPHAPLRRTYRGAA